MAMPPAKTNNTLANNRSCSLANIKRAENQTTFTIKDKTCNVDRDCYHNDLRWNNRCVMKSEPRKIDGKDKIYYFKRCEDRIVKKRFREWSATSEPVVPGLPAEPAPSARAARSAGASFLFQCGGRSFR